MPGTGPRGNRCAEGCLTSGTDEVVLLTVCACVAVATRVGGCPLLVDGPLDTEA